MVHLRPGHYRRARSTAATAQHPTPTRIERPQQQPVEYQQHAGGPIALAGAERAHLHAAIAR